MKPYNLCPFTFGNSLAAQNLSKIMMERGTLKEIKKISHIIHYYNGMFKACDLIDKFHKETIIKLVMERALNHISKLGFDKKITSYAANVIKTNFKYHLLK
jgi:hypothetical protein